MAVGLVLEQRGNNGFSEPISRRDVGSSLDGDFRYLLNKEKVDEPRLATPTPEVDERLVATGEPGYEPVGGLGALRDEGGAGDIEVIICSFDWPQGCTYWIAVAGCESGLRAWAAGYGGLYIGLFQVWTGHGYSTDWLLDPYNNTLAAWELSNGGTYTGAWPVCQWQ